MHALTLFEPVRRPPATRHRAPQIRLAPLLAMPWLVPALRRTTQIGMGAGLGTALGAVCGYPVFWVGLGVALGTALGAVTAVQGPAPDPGLYRVPQA